jgi:hypothetical protein
MKSSVRMLAAGTASVSTRFIYVGSGYDVACGDGLEVDPVVRNHHAKGFLDSQVKGATHALGDVPAEGAETTRHGAPGLCLAFFNPLAHLEGSGLQLLQLLLGRIVSHLCDLCLGR